MSGSRQCHWALTRILVNRRTGLPRSVPGRRLIDQKDSRSDQCHRTKESRAQRFLLEYDDARSGSFKPLKEVPEDKLVVLGLITTKRPHLEPMDELVSRIRATRNGASTISTSPARTATNRALRNSSSGKLPAWGDPSPSN
jgi:hypothetical protein